MSDIYPKVRFVASDPFGGGNLRSFWPSAELERRGYPSRCDTSSPIAVPGEYDIVMIHRPLWPRFPEKVRNFMKAGFKVVIDEDDDLTKIHQTKNAIGLQEWVPRAVKAHDEAMRMAHAITVSTAPLVDTYRALNPNVFLCRNALPIEFSGIRSYLNDGKIRVGWSGIVDTHLHDLEWIQPVSRQMLAPYIFSTVGDKRTLRVLGASRSEALEFQASPNALYKHMSRSDIAFIPLLPNEFNEAKSWLKALEYMTVGVPCVVTDLPEQRLLITHGEDGFLAKTPQEMADYVHLLANDHELRHTMAKKAHARAREMRIENTGGAWEDAVRLRMKATV